MAILSQGSGPQPQKNTVREFPINESSYLSHVKYDSSTLQLVVTMKGGSQYIYMMVFPMIVDQWMQSPSKGKFYATSIRGKFALHGRLVNKTVGPRGGHRGKSTGTGGNAGSAGR